MRNRASRLGVLVASVGVVGAGALMFGAGQESAQQEAQPSEAEPKTSSMVATYDPQALFEQSERSAQLTEKMTEFRTQLQQAQQEGDQQKMMQIQQQAQQLSNQQVEAFRADVAEVLPDVAKEVGAKIVAVEFKYVDESLGRPADLTEALSEEID